MFILLSVCSSLEEVALCSVELETEWTRNCFFLWAFYGTLVQPRLADGVKMTAEVLLKLAGQGSIYVRSLESIDKYAESRSDEDLELPFDRRTETQTAHFGSRTEQGTEYYSCNLLSACSGHAIFLGLIHLML